MKDYYGVLSGLAFTGSFAVAGIFAGVISDKVNRKMFIAICCVLWSACTFFTGLINSFGLLFVFRFLLGLFESAFNPCAYSIIADYFPPSHRGTANSILNLGIYFGGALSSLATLLIKSKGWRFTYELIGIIGAASGVLGFVFILEPKRGKFEAKKDEISTSAVKPKPSVCT